MSAATLRFQYCLGKAHAHLAGFIRHIFPVGFFPAKSRWHVLFATLEASALAPFLLQQNLQVCPRKKENTHCAGDRDSSGQQGALATNLIEWWHLQEKVHLVRATDTLWHICVYCRFRKYQSIQDSSCWNLHERNSWASGEHNSLQSSRPVASPNTAFAASWNKHLARWQGAQNHWKSLKSIQQLLSRTVTIKCIVSLWWAWAFYHLLCKITIFCLLSLLQHTLLHLGKKEVLISDLPHLHLFGDLTEIKELSNLSNPSQH